MSNRVTKAQLEYLVQRINEVTNSPMEYATRIDGKFHSHIGHYHLSGAYGGWMLARTVNNSGAIDCPLGSYHRPKRELYNEMQSFLRGIEVAQ